MASVTQRIKQITQPRGGYLKPSEFEKKEFIDNEILKEENIHSNLVGLAVDYLTRLMLDTPLEEAFKISLLGASVIGEERKAHNLLKQIKGIDDSSIYYTCKLVGYDVCFRAGSRDYKNVDEIEADTDTINNIKIMVKRSILFFDKYGPITKDGYTFEEGYTKIIDSGDGDFLTADTLWDFKVSKNDPTSIHTLQLLVYYIMGMHSIHNEFKAIQKLGIFNPRANCVYLKKISDISKQIIEEVSSVVIGYRDISNKQPQPSRNKVTTSKNKDLLSMADIMKALSCTRYMVMKYYSEKGLPLVKMNNKYFINRYDLMKWIERMKTERKRQQMTSLVVSVVVIILTIILFIFFMFNRWKNEKALSQLLGYSVSYTQIVERYDGSCYFNIMFGKRVLRDDRNGYGIKEYCEEETSTEEDDVFKFLYYFLDEYFDKDYPYDAGREGDCDNELIFLW